MRNDGSLLFLGVVTTPIILDLGVRGKEDQEFKTRLSEFKASLFEPLSQTRPSRTLGRTRIILRYSVASVNESPEQQAQRPWGAGSRKFSLEWVWELMIPETACTQAALLLVTSTECFRTSGDTQQATGSACDRYGHG